MHAVANVLVIIPKMPIEATRCSQQVDQKDASAACDIGYSRMIEVFVLNKLREIIITSRV
jgi:hypothetical protein